MKRLIVLTLLLTVTGAGNAFMRSKMSRLSEGMDKQKVISILGYPDGFRSQGDYQSLEYNHRIITGWSPDRADFHVILKDKKVIEYGMGEVRVKDGNVLFLVPLNFGK